MSNIIQQPNTRNLLGPIEASANQLPTPNDRRVKSSSRFIGKVLNYIVIPQFTLSNVLWLGASSIQLKFIYHLQNSFTLPVQFIAPENPTFIPVVRFDTGNVPTRYKLWSNIGELLYIDSYDGQLISKDFFIEIWNINGQATLTNLVPLILDTSLLRKPDLSQPDTYLCDKFLSEGSNLSSSVLLGYDNLFILPGFNPSTQHWEFDTYGTGVLVNN